MPASRARHDRLDWDGALISCLCEPVIHRTIRRPSGNMAGCPSRLRERRHLLSLGQQYVVSVGSERSRIFSHRLRHNFRPTLSI